ncbi:hypothetical protein Tco_1084258 [Tanacetum coccineum]
MPILSATRGASKGYTGVDIPLFPTMLTSAADEAASTCVDVRHGGATTTVSSLDVAQGSGNIDKTPTMPHDLPLPRVHTLGSDEGIMQHNELMYLVTKLLDRVVALEIDLSTTGAAVTTASASISTASPLRVSTSEDISIAEKLVYIRRSAAKDKGKAKMDESEPKQTKIKLQQRQEIDGYEATIRLQEQLDEDERNRITRRLSFDELKNLFETIMRRVGSFVPMETKTKREVIELATGSSKRDAEEELDQGSSKRQRTGDNSKPGEESKEKEDDELS